MQTAEELFQNGLKCLQQSNIDEAVRLFGEASKKKHAVATFYLAQLHAKDRFPGANPEAAVELYTILAKEHNDMQAKFELGVMHCWGKKVQWNPEEGSKWIKEFLNDVAAKGVKNLPFACYSELGQLYCNGRMRRSADPVNDVTADDLETAVLYLKKAVDIADNSVHPELLKLIKEQIDIQMKRLSIKKNIAENEAEIRRMSQG